MPHARIEIEEMRSRSGARSKRVHSVQESLLVVDESLDLSRHRGELRDDTIDRRDVPGSGRSCRDRAEKPCAVLPRNGGERRQASLVRQHGRVPPSKSLDGNRVQPMSRKHVGATCAQAVATEKVVPF